MTYSEIKQKNMDLIKHDLRGPLTNIEGFYNELELSVTQLLATINEHQELLPNHIYEKLSSIISDDVNPCLKYSHEMIGTMNDGLERLEEMRFE